MKCGHWAKDSAKLDVCPHPLGSCSAMVIRERGKVEGIPDPHAGSDCAVTRVIP